MDYKQKYLKYKQKYLKLRNQSGSGKCFRFGLQQHRGECWHDALTMILFQSDALNSQDEYINYIKDADINTRYEELKELFSSENIDTNCYMLPISIYFYYLENNSADKIVDTMEKINEFLEISKSYMHAQQKRMQNRIKNDEILIRYPAGYLLATFREGKELIKKDVEQQFEKQIEEFKKNKEKFIEYLEKTPDYPNRDEILKKMRMSPEEIEEYKKTEEYKKQEQQIKDMIEQTIKSVENQRILEESKIDKKQKLARRLSFRKSVECSLHILRIAKLFNLTKSESDVLSHGGNINATNLAIETIKLYVNTYNLYIYDFNLNYEFDNFNYILELINSKDFIGIDASIMIDGRGHAISFYNCGGNEIIYDDNLIPVLNNWKESLIRLLKFKYANKDKNIYYIGDDKILSNFTLYDINSILHTNDINKFNPVIGEKIKLLFEQNIKEYEETIKNFPQFKDLSKPSYENILKMYLSNVVFVILDIRVIVKIPKYEYEYEYIINNIMSDDIFDTDKIINRLIILKNIDETNNEKIIEMINEILLKNKNINYRFISKLFDKLSKNGLNYNEIQLTRVKILHNNLHLLKNESFLRQSNFFMDINMYILFLNNELSEIYLNKLDDEYKNYIIDEINKSTIYTEYYIFDGTDIINTNLIDAREKIKLINITNNEFKQKCIDAINKVSI